LFAAPLKRVVGVCGSLIRPSDTFSKREGKRNQFYGDCGWKKYGYNIAFKYQNLKNQTTLKGNGAMVLDT
jgi:hypothetical protein